MHEPTYQVLAQISSDGYMIKGDPDFIPTTNTTLGKLAEKVAGTVEMVYVEDLHLAKTVLEDEGQTGGPTLIFLYKKPAMKGLKKGGFMAKR